MTAPEIIAIITAAGTTIGTVITVYFKQKRNYSVRAADLKAHVETAVQKAVKSLTIAGDHQCIRLNGMLSHVIRSLDGPACLKVAQEVEGSVQFRILDLNEAFASLYNLTRSDMLTKTMLECGIPFNVADEIHKSDLMLWAGGEPVTARESEAGPPVKFRKIRVTNQSGGSKGILSLPATWD